MAESAVERNWLKTSGSERAYMEGNVGFNVGKIPLLHASTINSFRGFAWNANFGYQFSPYVALEVGFIQYKKSRVQQNADVGDAVIKGIWPTGRRIKLFGKVGINYLFPDNVEGKTVLPCFGAGFSVIVNSYADVVFQVIGVSIHNQTHLGALLVGLTLFFGQESDIDD